MGRTAPTYRNVLEALIGEWQGFRKALRKEDQVAFDRLMDKARGLASAAGYDPRTDPMESVFMSILVELEKEIEEPRKKVEVYTTRGSPKAAGLKMTSKVQAGHLKKHFTAHVRLPTILPHPPFPFF